MIVECQCGAINKVTVEYSNFGPANQDKLWANCAKCGKPLQRFKCFEVSVELIAEKGGQDA